MYRQISKAQKDWTQQKYKLVTKDEMAACEWINNIYTLLWL